MKRIIKIGGYAVMLFLVYIGSISLMKSCKGADNDGDNIAQTEDGYTSDEEIYDEFFESDEETAEAEAEVASSAADPEYTTTETDATEYDEDFSFEATESEKKQAKVAAKAKPAVKSTTSSTTTAYAGAGRNYLVVAGSYLIKDNAQKMVDKLKKLGYNNAEIVSFDESQYHSISAGRYDSYDSAGKVAKTLKQKGIDCYVHTRK